jgi:PAS domain-containing protein
MSAPDQWLRRIGVAIAGVIPLALEICYATNSNYFSFDPGPIGLSAALLILYGAIFSGGLFHTLPSAQLDLVHHLPVPMLIANRKGIVIDSNPAARALLGLTAQRALWRDVDEVLSQIDGSIESERWPILSQGHEAAQLVLLDAPLKPSEANRRDESITSGANAEEVPD